MHYLGKQTYCIAKWKKYNNAIDTHGNPIKYESCTCHNCDGRHCMDCVMRIFHDECENSCPLCCIDETLALQTEINFKE